MIGNVTARMPRGAWGSCATKKIEAPAIAGCLTRCLAAVVLSFALVACSQAQRAPAADEPTPAAPAAAPAASAGAADAAGPEAGGPPPMMAPRSLDISPYVAEVDADGDGCMSYDEWVVKAGAPLSSYNMLKNDQGCVTFDRMFNESAPGGIDANGDGKLTLAEMKEFDKKMAPLMEGKEPPPR
ncbi:MAG: EF-hand domain-containing protein [Pseudoxanthomonas sp.]